MVMKIALCGIGKIARDSHVPALAGSARWELAASVSRHGSVEGVPAFTDMGRFLEARPDIRAVSLCQPPVPRFDLARAALEAGRHVMLEKPPGATLAEVLALQEMAAARNLTLFASWHSREAPMVAPARDWLRGRTVLRARCDWLEDVRHWHPGQDWVFEPGGMGVFDPGINALSILTAILPAPLRLLSARLDVPENRATPIAAELDFADGLSARFDWLQTGPQVWDITVETTDGLLELSGGGHRLRLDGAEVAAPPEAGALAGEYPRLYDRFADLIDAGRSEVDLAPMLLVADACTLGLRRRVAPFDF